MAERETPLRILVVDDDPTMVRLACAILRSAGYTAVRTVGTGREALEALQETDLVLLDQQLPDTSGLEVLDAIRARPHPPSVVMVTAHGNESLAATALRRGADDYLAKDAALAALLPEVLERVRRNRELRKALIAAEQDLVRAERLTAIGEMTVTLHHEINNPLMAAFADVELLLRDLDGPAAGRRNALAAVMESLRRIRDIVKKIGDLREVRTKSYVGGVRMVDLASADRVEPAPPRGTALVCLAEEGVARIVGLLLRHAGFRVERSATVADLQRSADMVGVSLVFVMGTAAAAGAHPLAGFTPGADRSYRLVALVHGDGTAAREFGADRIIQLPFDPETFTRDLLELLD
jgi:DNA-binding response OmpR family regulator